MNEIQIMQSDSVPTDLSDVQATLLMPLWARAIESQRSQPLLSDARAVSIVEQLDYDFDKFHRSGVPHVEYCIRARVFDSLVEEFLKQDASSTVVEIGVGLDTRYDRLARDESTWIELDLPDVINLRRRFIHSHSHRHIFAGSLLDNEWMGQVEQNCHGPLLFVAEGVFYFFTHEQIRRVLQELADRFPNSGVIFDAQSPLFLWFSNLRHPLSDSHLKFSLKSPHVLKEWDDRFSIRHCVGFGDSPHYDALMPRVSWPKRWMRRLAPWSRHFFRVIHVSWT